MEAKRAFHDRQGGNLTANPEHGGGNIANWRPGSTGLAAIIIIPAKNNRSS